MLAGSILCDSVVSLPSTYRVATSCTHLLSVGSNQNEGILGSHPNLICQICHSPSHATDACPNHYQPHQQPVLPAYGTCNSVYIGEQVWYPNSTMTSHMTPDEGNLLSKTHY